MKYAPSPLTSEQAASLLAAARKARDRALVVLLWRAGLRCAEACAVRTRDLEAQRDGGLRVHVTNGKGGKARFVGLDKRAAEYVVRSTPIRSRIAGGDYVLRTSSGLPLQTNNARLTIKRLGQTAGLGRRVHPHALRHTFARDLLNEGYNVREIQLALGHAKLVTTQIYLSSLGLDEVVETMTRREW